MLIRISMTGGRRRQPTECSKSPVYYLSTDMYSKIDGHRAIEKKNSIDKTLNLPLPSLLVPTPFTKWETGEVGRTPYYFKNRCFLMNLKFRRAL